MIRLMDLGGPIIFIDFEATALDPHQAEPMEVAVALVRADGSIERRFSSLIAIKGSLPLASQRLTGITAEMLAGAPPFEAVGARLREFVGDRALLAHNVGYDSVLAARMGVALKGRPLLDSCVLGCLMRPELTRHSQDALLKAYGIDPGSAHRAEHDVTSLIALVKALFSTAAERPDPLRLIVEALRGSGSLWLPPLRAAQQAFTKEPPLDAADSLAKQTQRPPGQRAGWPRSVGRFFASGGPLATGAAGESACAGYAQLRDLR